MVDTIISNPFDDFRKKKDEEEKVTVDQGVDDPFVDLEIERPQPAVSQITPTAPEAVPVDDPFSDFGMSRQPEKRSLSVEDVIADPNRMGAIRNMMSKTKDVYWETAPEEEVMEAFMTHMRWMNTNEVSTARELLNVTAADEETKRIYGEAYKVYDEMGSMFTNGDAWNGVLDYGSAFVTSPSLWLGLGIGKVAGQAGTKAAATAATKIAIEAATKEVVKKSGGQVVAQEVKKELTRTAAKAAARYHVAGALAVEMPVATLQDVMLQQTRMEAGVQDEYSFLQGAVSTLAGGLGAVPGIITLRRSSNSTFAETGKLLDESFAQRARTSAKRAAPKIKASLERKQVDWAKLAEAGKGMDSNPKLEDAVFQWFFDLNDEDSLFRIIVAEGAPLDIDAPRWSEEIIAYSMSMGDEAIESFNEALKPVDLKFGEAVALVAKTAQRAGEVFNPISQSKQFYKNFKNISVAKKNSAQKLAEAAAEEVPDVELGEKSVLGYVQSTWKKMLVSTYPTTMVNVKGWAIARASTALADIALAGGLMGRAGIRAIVDPAGAGRDIGKMRSLMANQTFALQTLVDPFLSAEAFMELIERAPTKVKKRVSGQIFGGVDDFGPKSFGLDPEKSRAVRLTEKVSDFAQKMSLVHVQDTLTKGVSGLTALDRESRLAFGKGIKQLIEDGEVWKLTDEMWDKATTAVLRETFSEDLSKGTHVFKEVAKAIQDLSAKPGVGFIIPFGKFLNNTVAFTYRHSPLSYFQVAYRVFKGNTDDMGEMMARATVGSMALGYLVYEEGQKQKEGLQWFERRNDDGSIEDITTLFPYSVYALVGRMGYNIGKGEGMDRSLLDTLLQQLGPLDALESLAVPSFIKDLAGYLADPRVEDEEKNTFFSLVGDAAMYVGGYAADIAAGFTRPLDLYSRGLSFVDPNFGGGLTADVKQAEGFERIGLGLTRYTSAFFNYLLGEENEYGVRMVGTPRESATSMGPARIPNPAGTFTGTTIVNRARNINKLLGMVDKPPYLADSFNSGVPEYDAFINQQITPLLEERAKSLLKNQAFLKAPQSVKIDVVNKMLRDARAKVTSMLEGRLIGDNEDRLMAARSNLITSESSSAIKRAMEELGIKNEEAKLSLYEIEAIKRYISLEKEQIERIK